jgi:hypothetical protein
MQQILERLAAANIQLLPLTQIQRHWVFERDGFVSLVERTVDGGFGNIGAPGLLTSQGMAVLVNNAFVAKGINVPASEEQVESLRAFSRDLQAALNP